MSESISNERVEEVFNLADEIIRAPSRFTKDFVVQELGRGIAELAGAVERARAQLAEIGEARVLWGFQYYDHDAVVEAEEAYARKRASEDRAVFLVRCWFGPWTHVEQEAQHG